PQVVACVGIEGESGTAWFDELQLEEGEMANRFNLLENSDFTLGLTRWSTTGLVAGDGIVQSPDPAHPASFSDAVLSITGGASAAKSVLQTVPVSGAAGEVFVLGGWARGASVPLTGERKFALTLAIQRTDGTVQWARTAFNRDTQDWQYLCTPVLTDSAYTGVSVVVEYGQNLNSAAFDGLQLYREEFGQSYQYDAQGNLVATADLAKANTTFQYNTSHDLVKTVDPQGNFSTYTYSTEGKRRLTEAVTAEGVTYQFAYDDFGNPRQAVVQGNVYR
ncbi:RHS repeat protein, partial [Proteiniclasticum sp. BAD-10]